MKIPTIYSEWVECFNFLKTSTRSNEYINMIKQGKLEMDDSLLNRYINEIDSLVQTRLNNAINKFMMNLSNTLNNINDLTMYLIDLKKEFIFLFNIVSSISVLPKENMDALKNGIKKQADDIQKTLEEKIGQYDRTGLLKTTIKNNSINKLEV